MRPLPALRAVVLVALAGANAGAQGWSTAPLRSPTPVPKDGLPADRPAFLAWLRSHKDSLTPDRMVVVRERIYVYVSAEAKERGGRLPTPGDTASILPFVLASQLGDPGAMLITQQWMGAPGPRALASGGMVVRYAEPYLHAGSDDESWRVCYPYFFMTSPSPRTVSPAGVSTEVLTLSTLFAPDKGPRGSSQATVLIAAGPPSDSARFIAEWVARLELALMGPTEAAGQWYRGTNAGALSRVAVVKRLPKRVVLLVYLGARGTFETNRTHFETLVDRLGTGPCPP